MVDPIMWQERVEDYMRDTGNPPPAVEHLPRAESDQLRANLCDRLMLPQDVDGLTFVKALRQREFDTEITLDNDTPIGPILRRLKITLGRIVYVNWAQFSNFDCFEPTFVQEHLHELLYLGADYIDLFDESLSWIISISYECQVLLFSESASVLT